MCKAFVIDHISCGFKRTKFRDNDMKNMHARDFNVPFNKRTCDHSEIVAS